MGSGISQLKCLQYDCAREFPDYKKCSANNLSIDPLYKQLMHGLPMYTLSMDTVQASTSEELELENKTLNLLS